MWYVRAFCVFNVQGRWEAQKTMARRHLQRSWPGGHRVRGFGSAGLETVVLDSDIDRVCS